MGLSNLTLSSQLTWQLSKANTGFPATKFGPASQTFNLDGVDVSVVNQIANLSFTGIAASATQTVDLMAITNLKGKVCSLPYHVLEVILFSADFERSTPSRTGASNGLQWVFGTASTLVLPPGPGISFAAMIDWGRCRRNAQDP